MYFAATWIRLNDTISYDLTSRFEFGVTKIMLIPINLETLPTYMFCYHTVDALYT